MRVERKAELDRFRQPLANERKADVTNRLKSARGHIDHVLALIEHDAYVVDILRQIAAVRGALDATTRVALRHYFDRVFVEAVRAGEVEPAVDELMTSLAFLREID
jgi:DNA-binding FrmR family transcriptional regulator